MSWRKLSSSLTPTFAYPIHCSYLCISYYKQIKIMENKELNIMFSLDGYKAIVVVSLAVISVYAAKKFVDKLYGASVVFNADNSIIEGK